MGLHSLHLHSIQIVNYLLKSVALMTATERFRPSERTMSIRYAIRDVIVEAVKLEKQGHRILRLNIGDPNAYDFDTPEHIKEGTIRALKEGHNGYAPSEGIGELREAISEKEKADGRNIGPEDVVVTAGVTEALQMLFAALEGRSVLIPAPAYPPYTTYTKFFGAVPIEYPGKEENDWQPDIDFIRRALESDREGNIFAISVINPNNPAGAFYPEKTVREIMSIAGEYGVMVITDEIYDRILYDGREHLCPGRLEPLKERTITIGGLGKSYAITGWRLGYAIAPTPLARAVKPAHDFLTICAATPLQAAALAAFDLPESYYRQMTADYHQRRALISDILEELGFVFTQPQGAYYILADYRSLPIPQARWDATRFARWLTTEVGVAVVPGPNFYGNPADGEGLIRFAYPKQLETLRAAGQRLARLKG